MPTLERDGETIAYDITGSGPAVVLGHSLLCGRWMWRRIVPALAERYTVYNVEFRGHGDSTAGKPFGFADLVGDWLAILDHHGVERAALVGLSMGGMTAMRLALQAPGRVGALALLDTSAGLEPRFKRFKYAGLTWLYRRRGFSDFLVRQIAPVMFCRETVAGRRELIDELATGIRAHQREPLLRVIRAVIGRRDLPAVENLRAPTLVLVGAGDTATPPARSRDLERRIPGASLTVIPGAGHLSAMEQPEPVAAAIRRHLDAQTW